MLRKIESVLSEQDLIEVTSLLSQSEWQDGRSSAGRHAQQVKNNLEAVQSSSAWRDINALIIPKLYQHPQFQRAVLPARLSAAFLAHYSPGMSYGNHVDDPVMGADGGRYRADVAITIFLNSPLAYDGGELKVHTRFGAQHIKMEAGAAVVYPASSPHEVETVTRGDRFVAVLWAQSLIRDVEKREILADLDDALAAIEKSTPNGDMGKSAISRTYANLVRMWADV